MKRVISALLTFVLLFSVLLCMPMSVSAESMYIRKIVSVVYDDSGSMSGDKFAYANYAMQSFCGMLNSDDQLFITYMKDSQMSADYTPEKIDLGAAGIQNSVDTIRAHPEGGGTPYAAVEKAYSKLKGVQDSNPNTQYWLVVITDGAFDEHEYLSDQEKSEQLNREFEKYTNEVMPNGTNPQITFLGIGGVAAPNEDPGKGIHTYEANDAKGIIDAMSQMADRVSGRTRLDKNAVKQLDDTTLQVSSAIPLLNIAVFSHGSEEKVTGVVYSNESDIPISRKVSLSYPGYSELVGGAFLAGDSQRVIGSGTYRISFDRKVEPKDVIILFEPALEMRMTVSVNGTEITDYSHLDATMEGDKATVSCKLYEMGTDTEIDPSLLPPGTAYEISVSEDGKVVETVSGEEMLLSDYVLHHADTKITASVTIAGFNPIEKAIQFTPTEYVPPITYTVVPSFGSSVKSVEYDQIGLNKDMTLCFTVCADGDPITDPAVVQALHPVITVSPQGNDGTVTYADDGRILFTPHTAPVGGAGDSFDVEVTCTIDDGTSASEVYTVLLADYRVIAVDTDQTIKKTGFYGNQVSASFYVTKDGVQLGKGEAEKQISIVLNEEHSELLTNVVVAPDGTITVTPYSDEEHVLNFGTWWINWAYYFGLSGEDLVVTLSHPYGSASSTIDVIPEDLPYILLNVVLPFVIELAVLLFLLWWIYAIIAKPKFLPNASLYIGSLDHGGRPGTRYHEISSMREETLKKYNKFKYIWRPTLRSMKVSVGRGLSISAGSDGSIICHKELWYKGDITPIGIGFATLEHPQHVVNYIQEHDWLRIKVISPFEGGVVQAVETIDRPHPEAYYVHTDLGNMGTVDGIETIENGVIFAYAIRIQN